MANVEIYTGMMCGYCSAAKRLLKKKGVDFTETDVTWKAGKRAEMIERARGRHSVPQIFIDGEHVGVAIIDLSFQFPGQRVHGSPSVLFESSSWDASSIPFF